MTMERREMKLSTGAVVSVDEHRVRVDLPPLPPLLPLLLPASSSASSSSSSPSPSSSPSSMSSSWSSSSSSSSPSPPSSSSSSTPSLSSSSTPSSLSSCSTTSSSSSSRSSSSSSFSYTSMSSAILNGGIRTFPSAPHSSITKTNRRNNDDSSNLPPSDPSDRQSDPSYASIHVINYKVPPTYNGYEPNPHDLLTDVAVIKEKIDPSRTIGLMTAASMKTLAVASRRAGTGTGGSENGGGSGRSVCIDVIVTAGLSNARAAGAEADYFVLFDNFSKDEDGDIDNNDTDNANDTENNTDDTNDIANDSNMNTTADNSCNNNNNNSSNNNEYETNDDKSPIEPGTINTIIIINTPLTPEAMIEAYAIAIEAKCAACADLGVRCAKNSMELSQGTGTDSCVLICPALSTIPSIPPSRKNQINVRIIANVIRHAGKHTLFGEMIGGAVREATSEAIMINIRHLHGNYLFVHTLKRWGDVILTLGKMALDGSRPFIPPHPTMEKENPPMSMILLGVCLVILIHVVPLHSEKVRLLLAAFAWDKYLGGPPLRVHPVCLVGNAITFYLKRIPKDVFANPILGFVSGLVLLVWIVGVSLCFGRLFLWGADAISEYGTRYIIDFDTGQCGHLRKVPHLTPLTHLTHLIHPILVLVHLLPLSSYLLKVLLLQSTISIQLLTTISLQMAHFLERHRIDEGRLQLSWLCSRDAKELSGGELAGGTLESLSENLSDGFTGPLFYYVLGGLLGRYYGCSGGGGDGDGSVIGGGGFNSSPISYGILGALAYRAVNTLDSRVGYRGKYEWFGKSSARLDDVLNLVPARLTAIFLAAASIFVRGRGGDGGLGGFHRAMMRGLSTAWKDQGRCSSPNAGWPMACFAGVLGVRLEKRGEYCLGNGPEPSPKTIREGCWIVQVAGFLILMGAVVGCYGLG